MKIKNLVDSVVNYIEHKMQKKNLEIPTIIGVPTWEDRLNHIKAIGFSPNVIFDCGAFIGRWAVSVAGIYPDSQIVLIEPNTDIIGEIKKYASD